MRLGTPITAVALAGALFMTAACGVSGSGSSEKGVDGKVITVGLSSTLSGPGADFGNIGKGTEAYLKNVNAHGGVNGYTFTFDELDNQYVASTAVANARTLAPKSFMIVTSGTPPVQGILSVADSLKTPIFGAANGDFFTPASKYAFGQNPSYGGLAESDTRYIVQNLGIKKLALLYQPDDVGEAAHKLVPGYAKSLGATVSAQVAVPITATDFSSYAAKLKASGADAVISMMAPATLAGVQQAAVGISYDPKWTSIFATQSTSYTQSVPASVVANTYSDAYQLPVSGSEGNTYKKVVGKYYPKSLGSSTTPQGWNFGAIIAAAVKAATDGGKQLTEQGFLDALGTAFHGQKVGFIPSFTYNSSQHFGSATAAVYTLTPQGPGKQVAPFKPLPNAH